TTGTVIGVTGGKVALPCNITPPTADDAVSLILWYKDESTTPIYSLDARKGNLDQARHAQSENLMTRSYMNTIQKPATLLLQSLVEDDAGEYRCRVDFRKARTRNFIVFLKLIIPPEKPVIMDANDEILNTLIGPYNEGERLVLICEVDGGKPRPSVTWWRESVLLDDSYEVSEKGATRNELEIPSLQRHDLMAVFTCQASNNNISMPASADVTVDLNFRPLMVRIETERKPLSAGKTVEIICKAAGSRPIATITWWLGSQKMKRTEESHSVDGNVTTSKLMFTPSSEDSGKHLSCRAENQLIPGKALEDGWKLEIQYVPQLTLKLGSKLRHSHIQPSQKILYGAARLEAVNVYCEVEADPTEVKFRWTFNNSNENVEVTNHVSDGVMSTATYIPKSEFDYGTLFCWGRNSVGSQVEPCMFTVIPAGSPDPVKNCTVINQTEDSIRVNCTGGYDGGLRQHFVMEVQDILRHKVRSNITNSSPSFTAKNLPPGTNFVVVIYAFNMKGRSKSVTITASTLALPESMTRMGRGTQTDVNVHNQLVFAGNVWQLSATPFLVLLIAIVVVAVIIAFIIVIVVKLRPKSNSVRKAKGKHRGDVDKTSTPLRKSAEDVCDVCTCGGDTDDKCPDIIPDISLGSQEAITRNGGVDDTMIAEKLNNATTATLITNSSATAFNNGINCSDAGVNLHHWRTTLSPSSSPPATAPHQNNSQHQGRANLLMNPTVPQVSSAPTGYDQLPLQVPSNLISQHRSPQIPSSEQQQLQQHYNALGVHQQFSTLQHPRRVRVLPPHSAAIRATDDINFHQHTDDHTLPLTPDCCLSSRKRRKVRIAKQGVSEITSSWIHRPEERMHSKLSLHSSLFICCCRSELIKSGSPCPRPKKHVEHS
ncbi:nephrin-like protein, partial [Dinothrombium tinctorium]